MKYAVALGEIVGDKESLLERIKEFSDVGFDAMSFKPQQLLQLDKVEQELLINCLDERELAVTLHTGFDTKLDDLDRLAELLRNRLASITFDPVLRWTSAGYLFDTKRMCPYLTELDEIARAHDFCFGIEDFPEDPQAMEFYRQDLAPLLASPQFGILIDLGHLNLSVHKYGYINVSPEQYFAGLPVPLLEVHLSDNDGKEDLHMPLGMGNIDFKAMVRGLKAIDFDGISTIEIIPRKHSGFIQDAKRQSVESLCLWQMLLKGDQ